MGLVDGQQGVIVVDDRPRAVSGSSKGFGGEDPTVAHRERRLGSHRHYRQVLEKRPGFADAHYNMGLALESAGQIDEAIRHYREALRVYPRNPDLHYNLGNALVSRGQLEEAIRHYRQALRVKPDLAEARSNLDVALELAARAGDTP